MPVRPAAGLELLKAGLAWPYEHYLSQARQKVQISYRAAAVTARQQRRDLWLQLDPEPPWSIAGWNERNWETP